MGGRSSTGGRKAGERTSTGGKKAGEPTATEDVGPTSRWVDPSSRAHWIIVGQFEVDGQRYIIAREGEPLSCRAAPLTTRERQVARLAAAGRSAKSIAYDLGIASSTVRVLLARAARKIGEETRRAEADSWDQTSDKESITR